MSSRIRELREARGISQEALAHQVGVALQTISRLERGVHKGNVATLLSVAATLSRLPVEATGETEVITLDDLFGEKATA